VKVSAAQKKRVQDAVRERVIDKYGYLLCEKCKRNRHSNLEFRHKVNASQGGEYTEDNIFLFCNRCHMGLDHGIKVIEH